MASQKRVLATLAAVFAFHEAGKTLEEAEKNEERAAKRQRRLWSKEWLLARDTGNLVYRDIELEGDVDKFTNVFRMSPDQFDTLLGLVEDDIAKQETHMRMTICPRLRLQVALRFLTSGSNFHVLEDIFRISVSAIAKIVPEVCEAIWNALGHKYLALPQTMDEWLNVAEAFNEKWHYPTALGAIDGKHCAILAPSNSGSLFRNYKSFFSIVLLGLCDANYRLLWVDIGKPGAGNDSGIFKESTLYRALEHDTLNLPGKCSICLTRYD